MSDDRRPAKNREVLTYGTVTLRNFHRAGLLYRVQVWLVV